MSNRLRRLSRRDTLRLGTASFAFIASTGVSLSNAVTALAAASVRIRRNINDPVFGPDVAEAYRRAIGILKGRDPSEPKSFAAQASIHVNFCPHGNWYFVPWHRAYLATFEAICADALGGDTSFGLPYWNWTNDRILPPAVAEPKVGNVTNPLFNSTRTMQPNQTLTEILLPFGLDAETIFGQTTIDTIMQSRPFQVFGSFKPSGQSDTSPQWQRTPAIETPLEFAPHNICHGAVGGDMGAINTSTSDPVFYLHHCNIDRLWACWNEGGGTNDSDPLWRDFSFSKNFWDAQGQLIDDVKVSSLFDTINLGYRYDTRCPPPTVEAMRFEPEHTLESRFEVVGAALTSVTVELNTKTAVPVKVNRTRPAAQALNVDQTLMAVSARPRVFAIIDDISIPANRAVGVRVFINCPYLTPTIPSDDPHYAGAFTWFASSGGDPGGNDHGDRTQSVALDITDVLDAVRRAGTPVENEIVVQLLPIGRGVPPEKGRFQVGSVEIAVLST